MAYHQTDFCVFFFLNPNRGGRYTDVSYWHFNQVCSFSYVKSQNQRMPVIGKDFVSNIKHSTPHATLIAACEFRNFVRETK